MTNHEEIVHAVSEVINDDTMKIVGVAPESSMK